MKLTIDRRIWLRGEGGEASRLLRGTDNKQCCVGVFMVALGAEPAWLLDRGTVRETVGLSGAEWLWSDSVNRPSLDASTLYATNDDVALGDSERESMIIATFAKHGVEVEFTN